MAEQMPDGECVMDEKAMPVPDVHDVEVVFGTTKALPEYDDIPRDFKRWNGNVYVEATEQLFFKGGRLADYGLKVREGLDAAKVRAAVQAHLGSWDPKHEHKIAGVAWMLSHWTEPA